MEKEIEKINLDELILEVIDHLPKCVDENEIIDLCLKWRNEDKSKFWDAVDSITEILWPEEWPEKWTEEDLNNDETR